MQDPQKYENFKSSPKIDAEEFVPLLIKGMHWKEGENILDFGCGAGSVTIKQFIPMALLYNSTIDAVDISENMLSFAKTKNSHPSLTYHKGDILAADFPFPELHFHRIFSIYVLHFIKDFRGALKKFYNLLKPGGELGFTVVSKSKIFQILEAIGQDSKWSPYMEGYKQFLPEWYEKNEDAEPCFTLSLKEIGFEILQIRTEKRAHEKQDVNTLAELVMSLNPYLDCIPKKLHPELKEDYKKYYLGFSGLSADSTSEVVSKYEMVFCLAKRPMSI